MPPTSLPVAGCESSTYKADTQFRAGFGGQGVTGWTGLGSNHLQFYYFGGTQTSVNAINQVRDQQAYLYPSLASLSPNSGNFVAIDGISLTTVPEPATRGLLVVAFGLVGFATRRRVTAIHA